MLKSSRNCINVKDQNCYADVGWNTQQFKSGGWLWFTEGLFILLW